LPNDALKLLGQQFFLAVVVAEECSVTDIRPLGNIPNGDGVETLLLNQIKQRFSWAMRRSTRLWSRLGSLAIFTSTFDTDRPIVFHTSHRGEYPY
jgi:hypothetical protein